MRFIKNIINHLYWNLVGEINVYITINGKFAILSLKRGELHRLYAGPKAVVEFIKVVPRGLDNEEFNSIKAVYEL